MRSPRSAASLPSAVVPWHERCGWPGTRFLVSCALFLFLWTIPGLHGVALGLNPVLRGVNDAGGEFIPLPLPEGHPLTFSSPRTLEYIAGKGLKLVRLPFAWEQMQPIPGGPLDPHSVAALRAYLEEADRRGLQVIPDLHNYARFNRVGSDGLLQTMVVGDPRFPSTFLADFWRRMAEAFRDAPAIYAWGLMNEPHDIVTRRWEEASQEAVTAIRETGDRRWILVPGSNWSAAHIWVMCHGYEAWIRDPLGRVAYEAHCYLNAAPSFGMSYAQELEQDPDLEDRARRRLQVFADWCDSNGVPGFIGEFGSPADPGWLALFDRLLNEMDRHRLSGTAWALGEKWPLDYALSLHPDPVSGEDRPSMKVLLRHPGGRTLRVWEDFLRGYRLYYMRAVHQSRPLRESWRDLRREWSPRIKGLLRLGGPPGDSAEPAR
jgi:endoglucanase